MRWSSPLEEETEAQWAPPAVTGGLVVVRTTPGHPGVEVGNVVHAVRLSDGSVRWRADLGGGQGFTERPTVVGPGRVFVHAPPHSTTLALDTATGAVVWRSDAGWPLARVAGGLLVVRDRAIRLLDPVTGRPTAHEPVVTSDTSVLGLHPARVADAVVAATDRELVVLSPDTGAPIERIPLPSRPTDLAAAGDHVLVATEDRAVHAFTVSR